MSESLSLLTALIIKHFVCDFPLQRPYQYINKGKYGHPGGLLHGAIHGACTLAVLVYFGLPLWLAAADAFLHYHIDWMKVKINTRFQLRPDNSEWFWILLGADQLIHSLTYVWIATWK